MFGGLLGKDDSKKFTEFKSGHDRIKYKSLDKRLERQDTYYRGSMPAPVEGSAPGIDAQRGKVNPGDEVDGSLPGTSRGVNFFGYAGKTKVNRFSQKASEVSTNPHAVDKVTVSGFTTGKKAQDESDYGKGVPGAAAEASFYRNRITTERYGELYASKTNPDNVVAFSRHQNIISDADGNRAGYTVEQRNQSFNNPPSGKPPEGGMKQPGIKIQAEPLSQVNRKLPGDPSLGGDLWLKLYLEKSIEDGGRLGSVYKPMGEQPEGGSLPYQPNTLGQWYRYEDEYTNIRTAGVTKNQGTDNPVDSNLNQVAQSQQQGDAGSSSAATGIKKLERKLNPSQELNDLGVGNLSHLIVGHSDTRRTYKKSFYTRKDIIHSSPKIGGENSANPEIRRKSTMSDTTAESASNLNDRQQTDAYDVPKSGEDRTIQERMDTRYHPEDILPKISELPKSTPNESSAPKNITIHKLQRKVKLEESLPEAGRSNTAHDTFQKNYTDSLNTRIGTTGSQKNFNNHKKQQSLIDALVGKGGEKGESKQPNSFSDDKLKYETNFKGTPYYLHGGDARKIPDYSQRFNSSVSEKEDNFRIDNFNKKSVLDASDHADNKMPAWATEDFVPLYFHDLVNKKYIPFRSYIKSLSDQSTAEWATTRYLGRADQVVVYTGFTRTMSVEFDVVAFSIDELHPMWQRINYMVGLTKPAKYTEDGFIVPPMIKFNLGDIYRNQPVYIGSVDTSIPQEATWELINNDKSTGPIGKNEYEYANADIKKSNVKVARYPTMCTLNVSMTLLEKEIPETIQNHFGTTKKVSELAKNENRAFGVFNYDLTSYS